MSISNSLNRWLKISALIFGAALCFRFLHGWILFGGCAVLGTIIYAPKERNASSSKRKDEPPLTLSEDGVRRILIVGSGEVAKTLAKSLEENENARVVGFVDDDPMEESSYPYLGSRDSIMEVIEGYHVEEVILAYAPTWQQRLIERVNANPQELTVRVVPTLYESLICPLKLKTYRDIALVPLIPNAGRLRKSMKRVFDIVVTTLLMILSLPLWLLASLLIRITSKGPVIFSQERIGKDEKPFRVFKFRTMVHNAEADTGPVLSAGREDARLTRVGRWLRAFRIDELHPQHHHDGFQQDAQIQRQGLICHIDQVVAKLIPGIGVIAAVHLCQTRNTRLHLMP